MALKEETRRSSMVKVENRDGHDDRFSAMLKALYLCYNAVGQGVVATSKAGVNIHQGTVVSHNTVGVAPGITLRYSSGASAIARNKRDYTQGRA
jgi:hypothetical protein